MKKTIKRLLGIFIVVLLVVVAINYRVVFDWALGAFYNPSSEMALIRENLSLTARGVLIFNASYPELSKEEEFNRNCYSHDEKEAILGCYKGKRIYVYNVQSEELRGILELTAAHELLHAVYERMSVEERDDLRKELEEVYLENRSILGEEVELYNNEIERLEEIYVRVGTEIKELPGELERHYAEIFRDQDKIVSFYNGYITVFREIECELKSLEAEISELGIRINESTTRYEGEVAALNIEITAFNECADTPGCFSGDYAFYNRRNELAGRQTELQELYDEISEMVKMHNKKVDEYNNVVLRGERLQNVIDSRTKVEEL